MGEVVRVALRVDGFAVSLVSTVELLVCEKGVWTAQPMAPCGGGFAGTVEPNVYPHVVFYAFKLFFEDESVAYCVPRADGRSTAGELVFPDEDGAWGEAGWVFSGGKLAGRPMGRFGLAGPAGGFQLTVYEPAFATPDWLKGAVMYQVFPDRFARGSSGVRGGGVAYHERMGRPVHMHENWEDAVSWEGGDEAYDPLDFYGGTLEGIREKLPYLASLGVEVLYLNPVFEARSSHRYDTADYERIDPILGCEDDFKQLASEARACGISIVLDAVLSHTGDDSRYFNARGAYAEPGAAQGPASPFFSWYDFSPQPDGAPYRSWWGHRSLPEVNEHDPAWQRYILGSDDGSAPAGEWRGVLGKWIGAGVRGYRLDVADELPDDVLSRIRTSVKAADAQAAIIGEVWEDPTTKVSYGSAREYALGRALDSVMNYPLREAVIGFALGRVDALQLAAFLKGQQANYPKPLYACAMNLLSSHDVERVRSVLALGGELKDMPRREQRKAVECIGFEADARAARLQRMVAGLVFALPGAPCIYYGDERGMQGGGDPFCRAPLPWGSGERIDCGEDLTAFYQRIGQQRKASPALRTGEMACCAPHPDVLCVVRAVPGGLCAVAVANRSGVDRTIAVDLRAPDMCLPENTIAHVPCSDSAGLLTCKAPACSTLVIS